jgi:hypothetical protein
MDKYLTRVLQLASENPEYKALSDYLISRRAFPEIEYKPNFSDTFGSFKKEGLFTGNSVRPRGLVKLNAEPQITGAEYMTPTLTHELTHATENQLIKQYYEIKNKREKTDLEKQFMDNFQKIIGSSEPQIRKQIEQLSPEYSQEKSSYRASSAEGLAFGLQNSAYPENVFANKAPAHVDPTIATQLMLLLEQAQRVQNQQPQSQGR